MGSDNSFENESYLFTLNCFGIYYEENSASSLNQIVINIIQNIILFQTSCAETFLIPLQGVMMELFGENT